jgi:hypothetical protein
LPQVWFRGGGGRCYSASLHQLSPGARIFACIPKKGNVGVGTVTESVVPVRDFVVNVDDTETPILDMDLKAPSMDHDAEDPELPEYLVRVEWQKTLSVDGAVWEKGMYANQDSATKLLSKFTLERLVEHFDIEDLG